MKGSFLGPKFSDEEIEKNLKTLGANSNYLDEDSLLNTVSDLLVEKLIGWFQGALEYGQRALGNRSIIAHPGDMEMQHKINMKIKFGRV